MYRPLFSLLILAHVFSAFTASAADALEIFYFDKQQAYRVSGFEDGKPAFEEVADELVQAYEGQRNDAWWVRGDLPLEPGKAFALVDYQLRRVANKYQERSQPTRYSVELYGPGVRDRLGEVGTRSDMFLVLAWVRNGSLERFSVQSFARLGAVENEIGIGLEEGLLDGQLFAWAVQEGGSIATVVPYPWDLQLMGQSVPIGELADFREEERERTALHYAAGSGDLELVRQLLEADKKLVRRFDSNDYSPLSAAVTKGRADVVDLLLQHKAPLEDGWQSYDSIVTKAAVYGHFETLKLLAPSKPKGDKANWHYSGAASESLNRNYEDIALYLIELGAKFSLTDASQKGQFALTKAQQGYPGLALKLFEQFKVEPTFDDRGYNLLHSVASYADVALLDMVRELGVSLTDESSKGHLPVDHALALGNVEAICWFLDNGGRDKLGEHSMDPMKFAIRERQLSSVECLINYGFDVNKPLAEGLTPLMYATFLEEEEIARSLVRAGGVWLLDSALLDTAVVSLVQLDDAELLRSLLGQGWEEERLVHGAFRLAEIAAFHHAESILGELGSLGWDLSKSSIRPVEKSMTPPKLLSRSELEYPLPLQEKFGAQNPLVNVAIDERGRPLLVDVDLPPEQSELVPVVRAAVFGLVFEPATKGGAPVSVGCSFRVPLKPDFDPDSVYSLAVVHEKPTAVRMATPLYPYQMRFLRISGKVLVEFILDANGRIHQVKAVERTHEAFVAPALDCVKNSVFKPAMHEGKPVACKVRVPIHFSP